MSTTDNILVFIAFFAVSLVSSILLTPAVRLFASRYGLTDKPDQRRKLHSQTIPVAGGIAVLLATLATMAIMLAADLCPWRNQFDAQALQWLGLAGAAIIISCVGVIDDWGYLRGRHKLIGQVLAIAVLISTGPVVNNVRLAGLELELGILAIPFTAFFLLGAINSLNLLDGMDGLLSTVAVIITLAFGGMAAMSGEREATACVAVTMAGALLGFLRYNFPPATIYLGDTGSMLIGLVIGSLAITSSLKGAATVALAAPLAILAIPILDTTAAIFRRKLTGRSIYTTDRGHLHHCLLRLGFSKEMVLFLVSSFCLVAAGGAYLSVAFNNEWLAVATALTVAAILIGMRWFGHGEMLLVGDRLKGLATSLIKPNGMDRPQDSAIRLQGSGAWAEQWASLTQHAGEMGLRTVCLDINAPALHESYYGRWINPCDDDGESGDAFWNVAIPLTWQGQTVGRLEVSGGRDGQPVWTKVATLTKIVDELETNLCKIAEGAGLSALAMPNQTDDAEAPSAVTVAG